MKLKLQKCLDVIDAMDIVGMDSLEENNGKINPNLAYAIYKNKKMFEEVMKKNKNFMHNFNRLQKYNEKCNEIEKKYSETKKNKKKKIKHDEEIDSLKKDYSPVIEENNKFLNEIVEFPHEFYKIKINHLSNIRPKVMNFLIENNLILE